jgi:hypothetical protein
MFPSIGNFKGILMFVNPKNDSSTQINLGLEALRDSSSRIMG